MMVDFMKIVPHNCSGTLTAVFAHRWYGKSNSLCGGKYYNDFSNRKKQLAESQSGHNVTHFCLNSKQKTEVLLKKSELNFHFFSRICFSIMDSG